MAGISGIGSGIDIDSIVGALVGAEKGPKAAQLARLEKATTTRFSGLGQLKGALSELQTVLKDLNKPGLFAKRSASSSDSSILTASATNTALSGSYSLKVSQLATGSKAATASFAAGFTVASDLDADTVAGSLTVKVGPADTGTVVEIAEGASLAQVRDTLNSALKDKGVTANLVTNPADNSTRLVLSSSTMGANKNVEVSYSGVDLAGFEIGTAAIDSNIPSSHGLIEASRVAKFSIDGVPLESASNTVSTAIPEVTFNLLSAAPDKAVTLKVDQDKSGATASIKKFVDTYNKLLSATNQLTAVVQVGEGKPPVVGGLVGDATVRTLLSSVRNELVAPADQEGVRILADLGITTQKDGTLKIDDAKLGTALAGNYDAVASFFTGDNGLMQRIDKRIDGYIKSGGILQQRMDGLQGTLKSVDKQKVTLDQRIEQVKTRLYAQFNAMDSLVGQLNKTSERLTQSLGSLPGVVKQSR